MEITALEQELEKWHEKKYGRSEIDIPKTMRKLGEEFGEFIESVMGGLKSVFSEHRFGLSSGHSAGTAETSIRQHRRTTQS